MIVKDVTKVNQDVIDIITNLLEKTNYNVWIGLGIILIEMLGEPGLYQQ